jgi:sialidase-1
MNPRLSRLLSFQSMFKVKYLAAALTLAVSLPAAQFVEGFEKVVSHKQGGRYSTGLDFRGVANGYMTAGWYIPGHREGPNTLSWQTAPVPAKEETTFVFIGSSSVLPSEFSRGPEAKLSVNGKPALTFTIGFTRDITWSDGQYSLKYRSKRVEYPYTSSHRLMEPHGNSGIYELTVPASAVEAGKPAVLEVELLPFAGWTHGWFAVKERRDVLAHSSEQLQGEIDALRHDVTMLRQQTQILATRAYGELFDAERFRHEVLYTNGYRHVHPADLIKLQNGDLLLMWREATEHISNDGEVVMIRSKDGGKTWGDRSLIAAIKDVDEREGCGVQLKDGTIIVGIFYNNLYRPDGTYAPTEGRAEQLASPNQRYLGAYTITSKDNGVTWSEPNYVDTAGMPFNNLEGPTDAPIEMPDGSVIMALIGYSPRGEVGNHASVLVRSTDQGKSWNYVSTIADDPSGKLGGFLEPGIVRTTTGRIIAAMRNHGTDQAIWVTHSDDNGKTWAPVRKTTMIGHPVDLIQISDGRIMATYGIRNGRHTTPGGIRACFSTDNGETWDLQTEVQLRNDFLNWDIGYPESLQMPDGSVLTVYYYNLFNKFFIGGTHWKP